MDDEITQLLGDTDEESRFRRIGDLVLGRPDFGLSIARTLIESADSRQRTLGADIVGQAATVTKGVPESYVQLLRSRLDSETNPEALAAAIIALGHLGDPRARDGVGGKASHSDAEVRTAVAFSLPALGLTEETIAVLEGLTRDPETEVRDWATFAIAESDFDDETIRAILMERTEDRNEDVRAEGVYGLARRHDRRAAELIERELALGSHGSLIERAREALTGSP